EFGTRLRLARANSRTEPAARPHLLAQGSNQAGIFGETLGEDRRGAFQSGGRISCSFTRFDISASNLLRRLVVPREQRLCQRLEASFARDLDFRPPLRPKRQI